MSRRILVILVFGLLCLVAGVFLWRSRSAAAGKPAIAREAATPPAPAPSTPSPAVVQSATPPSTPAAVNEKEKNPLEAMIGAMEKMGASRFDSPQAVIDAAVQSKDREKIAQAINEIVYGDIWPRDSVIATLGSLLKSDDLETQLEAARSLYVMGDSSGQDALIALVRSPSPIVIRSEVHAGGSFDLRLSAAEVLADYRVTEAKSALLELYNRTKARKLLRGLAEMGAEEAAPLMKAATHDKPSSGLMETYGLVRYRPELHRIRAVKNNQTADISLRLAAAWAETRIDPDESASRLIRDYVASVFPTGGADNSTLERALKYLGTLEDSASVQLLNQVAQESSQPIVVRIAVTNLMLNHQGQSAPAREMVAAELGGTATPLGRELALRLASVSSDVIASRAGEDFDRLHPENKTWKRYGINRAQWSPWSWVSDYVITLPNGTGGPSK